MTATTTTIRVSEQTHQHLSELSRTIGRSIQDITADAVELYRRQQLFALANADYAALRADPEQSALWDSEQAAWDVTLADGLEKY